jgi:kumamolisin
VFQRAINEGCDVITHSWGTDESSGYGSFLESTFANAAAQGITIFCSSGDNGSEGAIANGVITVDYPASSPNVIAVGGTILNYNTSTYARFAETPSGSSGGGVSTLFSVPSWQTGLTANLFFSSNSYSHVTSLTGRGVPDISAPYQTYVMWYNGGISSVSGTSAATPIMAGMFARYISITGRRPVTGAIHKILYSNSSAYFDFGVGYNNNETLTGGATGGYATASGWDPVVGLGAPNGTAMYQEISSGGTTVKTAANTWSYVANVKVKTATNTWSNVKAIYTKTINGWSQTF